MASQLILDSKISFLIFSKRNNHRNGLKSFFGKYQRTASNKMIYTLHQGSPNFFEGGPDNKETISSRAGQIIQS